MKLKGLIDEDIVNYKKISMFIAFPRCTFKCGKELCQNSALAVSPDIEISTEAIVRRYIDNPMTHAIVCGGLEPFDSFNELIELIESLRKIGNNDDIVIYSGYEEDEIKDKIEELKQFKNIIIKFGRYKPDDEFHYDEILGVNLISKNQYAKRVS